MKHENGYTPRVIGGRKEIRTSYNTTSLGT